MEIINIAAIIVGPVVAVGITLWWQRRKEKRDAKQRLFLTLMAHRRSFPPAIEWVNALNVIDVVFAEHPQAVQLWHEYYAGLVNPPANQNFQQREHTYLLMLSAMARSLGYRRLEQTDIDKFYTPQVHGDQMALNYQCQTEWLRVLKNTARIEVTPQVAVESGQPDGGANSRLALPSPSPREPSSSHPSS
jgi:hypothetical protein